MTGTCKAICQIASSNNNNVLGYLTLTQQGDGVTTITGTLSGLTAGKHGLSVNTAGDLSEGAKSCGVIFNPFGEFWIFGVVAKFGHVSRIRRRRTEERMRALALACLSLPSLLTICGYWFSHSLLT